ncbi:MAG: flagellar assembly peptidoglycan hydrolase FlgJ [Aquincola sp.]|nr:flagellar assembly peptidoglycan hydrolase FlgJ [Aquincola sp.]MDH4287555.1 flagellar assembly peptidoglycan hydrolase FlgJ [Aquincola sp.]MDH5329814.1 flagellar assembly peptidoglycan hydrolase FlgJ [Aquincola sp.]
MTASLRADPLQNLRSMAARDPKAAIKEAAKQFEGLFMQELMKSMRQATMSSGLLDNEGTQMGTELLDTEFAGKMTGLKGGLSEAIARQLERQTGLTRESATSPPANNTVTQRTPLRSPASASEFVARHTEAAQRAERQTGIPATFMVAQAAHETGWGRKEIRMADGSNSFNLFGVKAGADWKGPVARVTTTEVVDGQPRKLVQAFRAYSSYDESFADYAKLMRTSPRYREVVAQAADARLFAQGLQRAGYATDPAYADKLGRVINTTLRLQRSMA